MKRAEIILAGLALAIVPSPSFASIIFTVGNLPQPGEELVAFADQSAATTVNGVSTTNASNTLSLTGTTTTGNQFVATSGHVSADSGLITSLVLSPSSFLSALIVNPTAVAGTPSSGSTINFSVLDNLNNVFTFGMTLGNGNNFLTITTAGGEAIQSVTINDSSGITDVRNFAAVFLPGGGVPEPGTWALMLLGFGAIGSAFRRHNKRRNVPV